MKSHWRTDTRSMILDSPVYTPEEVAEGGVLLLSWDYGSKRGVRKMRSNVAVGPAITCPTCGQGEDTDGDGNCPLCKDYLKIQTAR